MKIIRVDGEVERSSIDGTRVSSLPEGLRVEMISLLNKLTGVKIIYVDDALFELPEKNVGLDFFDPEIKKAYSNTIALLKWYLGIHWRSMARPGTIGGTVYCSDCGMSAVAGGHGTYCPSPDCPSHLKWQMVIGPSYKPPEHYEHNPLLLRGRFLRGEKS